MVFGLSAALRRYFFFEYEGDLQFKKPYILATHWDTAHLRNANIEYPASITPPNARWHAWGITAATFFSCSISKNRHQEKWWFGGVILTIIFFIAGKYHSCDNGVFGHLSGLWGSVFGVFGSSLRLIANSGNKRFHTFCALAFFVNIWYEIGRFHMWNYWFQDMKASRHPGARRVSVWAEFTPKDIPQELLIYRPLHTD